MEQLWWADSLCRKTVAILFLSPPNIQFSTASCLYIGFSEGCFWGNAWQGGAVRGPGGHSCFLIFHFVFPLLLGIRILIPRKLLINSVALTMTSEHLELPSQGSHRPGSSMDFLLFAPSSAAGHRTNPGIVRWGCQGLEQLRAN